MQTKQRFSIEPLKQLLREHAKFEGCYFVDCTIFNLQNKMYGIESTLLQKMQMRLRQKIYKEMLEEQSKYNNQKLQQSHKPDYQGRYKTQASPLDRNTAKSTSHSYQFEQTAKGLDHSSTFLPVINKPKSRFGNEQAQEHNYSKEYMRYLKRRGDKLEPSKPNNYKIATQQEELEENSERQTIPYMQQTPAEESDDQRTQLYLQQCEQIISSLKQLTIKNSKKVKPIPNKYQPQETFYEKKAPSRSFRINQDHTVKAKSSMPKHYSFSEPRTQAFTVPNQFITTNQFQVIAKPHSKLLKLPFAENNMKTEFNEFADLGVSKKIKISQNIRQNHRSLSPLKQQRNFKDEKEEEGKEQTSKSRNKKLKSRQEDEEEQKPQKAQKKAKEKSLKPKQQKGVDKSKKQKAPENEVQSAQKKQNAIIKYLKKARACGNILYQKIESRKKNDGQAEEQNPAELNPPNPT